MKFFRRESVAAIIAASVLVGGCYQPVEYTPRYPQQQQRKPVVQKRARPRSLAEVEYMPYERLIPSCDLWKVRVSPEPIVTRPYVGGVEIPKKNGTESLSSMSATYWGDMVHRVQRGDTLFGLAKDYYGNTAKWQLIRDHNAATLKGKTDLTVGMFIYLPTEPLKGTTRRVGRRPDYYVVDRGDTLYKIAAMFLFDGKYWKRIQEANRGIIPANGAVTQGQQIAIPK